MRQLLSQQSWRGDKAWLHESSENPKKEDIGAMKVLMLHGMSRNMFSKRADSYEPALRAAVLAVKEGTK